MTDGNCFISYSTADALEFATKLANELAGGYPSIPIWFDKRHLRPGMEWDTQIDDGLKTCRIVLFVMTADSTNEKSVCKQEWSRALSYKKLVIPLLLQQNINTPFRLGDRQRIDFTRDFQSGLDQLRRHIAWLDSPEGVLQAYKDRLSDAQRDLQRTRPEDQARIRAEIDELTAQIKRQEEIVRDPEAARKQTEANIQSGLERERQPEKPIAGKAATKFINPPPGIAPTYFQDRQSETKEIVRFLHDDAQRLLTVVGRGGVGKTAMVCRLLKHLENGDLPDDLAKTFGETKVDGIVYLSESGSHRINFANIFADLSKLLPAENAAALEALYKNPQVTSAKKMSALLDQFPAGRTLLLLDNLEPLINVETFGIGDAELDESLRAFLGGAHSGVKIVLTTRIVPRALNLVEPGRQRKLPLDEGLDSPYAENILREMDADGKLGLKTAPDALLARAREHTRGYPRALEALFAILSSDRYTTLEELLEISLPENVVQSLVGEAFSRLDGDAQKVMQALAVYNRPVSPAAVDYLLQPRVPGINSAGTLNRLVTMQFARREAGKYYLHPVDREYAFGIIPVEDQKALTAKTAESAKENLELLFSSARADEGTIEETTANYALRFTQYALLHRAADYFAQARKPREEWKKLDDLGAQLAEFDLRCEAGDYDTAADVLTDIDSAYLQLWGHDRLLIDLHEKLRGKIKDNLIQLVHLNTLGHAYRNIGQVTESIPLYENGLQSAKQSQERQAEGAFLGSLGIAYYELGEMRKAIEYYEIQLLVAREIGNKKDEGIALGNLGGAYADLGDVHKAIEFYGQALVIDREIDNQEGGGVDIGNLGGAYADLGDVRKAIEFYEQALVIERKIGDRRSEGVDVGNLGSLYADLDDARKAIEFYEQALVIAREIGNRRSESINLESTGYAFLNLDEYQKAKENYKQAIQIADEISLPLEQNHARWGLAQVYLFQNDLFNARAIIEAALQYDVPQYNHNASALHGIIALRQGERGNAQAAFTQSIAQADEILAMTPDFYNALDAKGLAISGLILYRGAVPGPGDVNDIIGRGDPAPTMDDAIETFRAARRIAAHAGVVKRVLRLFDELAKCGPGGALAEVRKAAEGVG